MALFTLVIAAITALLTSFFSLAPGGFYGLVPWIAPRPSALPPSPAPSTPSFFAVDFWESIPTTNLSVSPSSSPLPPPPPPPPIFFAEEDEYEDPSAEEALRELWAVLRVALQRITTSIDGFLKLHPCLATKIPDCRLRPCWHPSPVSRVARSRRSFRARVRFARAGSRSPPTAAAAVVTFSPSPPTPPSPLASPAPLVSSPAPAFSPPASPAPPPPSPPASPPPPTNSPPPPSPSPPPQLLSPRSHLRLMSESREQDNRILALEDEVQRLLDKIVIVEMQRGLPAWPPSAPPSLPAPTPAPLPAPAPVPSRLPVPAPPLRPSAPSFSPPHGLGYPQRGSGYPQQARRPDLLSPEEFFKRYPQTGRRG